MKELVENHRSKNADAEARTPGSLGLQTAAGAIYERLRVDIISCGLPPGFKLRLNDISKRYGCGPIPIREALSRLAAEALVVYSNQKGFAVAPVSTKSLMDLAQARAWTSEVAMREAVLRGDDEWEERVLLSYHRLSKVHRYSSENPRVVNPLYDRPHREFHKALFSGCGSEWMIDACMHLFDHAERYRNLSRHAVVLPRENEHKLMVDAALARNVEEAVRLIQQHVLLTAQIVRENS
jgi:GntR family transcriptional regulator, carbon starvation induced regulator